jgi:hypothetical protein
MEGQEEEVKVLDGKYGLYFRGKLSNRVQN